MKRKRVNLMMYLIPISNLISFITVFNLNANLK